MSEVKVKDGSGSGYIAKVDAYNRIRAKTDSSSISVFAAEEGFAWNINTGILALTDDSAHGILYVKNTGAKDFVIQAIAVGIGKPGGTVNDPALVTLTRNPTGGTVISDKTAVSQNQNRNFGSSNTFDGLAYKGGQGKTLTGGDDTALFYQPASGRLFAVIDFILPQGQSMGLTIATNATSGANIYAAVVGYLEL